MVDLTGLMRQRLSDLWAGCTTLPTAQVWRQCLLYYLVYLAAAVPVGWASGLLRVLPLRVGPAILVGLLGILLIHPALVEEIIFRGLLLPQNTSGWPRSRLLAVAGVSLVLFVAWHPINGLLLRPAALEWFANPWFLVEAAMLGATCTAVYLASGSIWPSVLAHWLTVTVWITLLGGQGLVRTDADVASQSAATPQPLPASRQNARIGQSNVAERSGMSPEHPIVSQKVKLVNGLLARIDA